MKKINNPVAKYNNEFNKPKTFRDRKKKAKQDGNYSEHPKHAPYEREYRNYVQELLEQEDEYGD